MVVVANELGDLCTRMWRSLGGAADVAEVLTASGPRAVLPCLFRRDRAGYGVGGLRHARRGRVPRGPRSVPAAAGFRRQPRGMRGLRRRGPVHSRRVVIARDVGSDRRELPGRRRLDPAAYQLPVSPRGRGAGARRRRPRRRRGGRFRWKAGDLEAAVVSAGGCAAVMRARETWLASAPGAATATATPVVVSERRLPAGRARRRERFAACRAPLHRSRGYGCST